MVDVSDAAHNAIENGYPDIASSLLQAAEDVRILSLLARPDEVMRLQAVSKFVCGSSSQNTENLKRVASGRFTNRYVDRHTIIIDAIDRALRASQHYAVSTFKSLVYQLSLVEKDQLVSHCLAIIAELKLLSHGETNLEIRRWIEMATDSFGTSIITNQGHVIWDTGNVHA